jgi:hypothetical protein
LNVITRSGGALAATARGADDGELWQAIAGSVASAMVAAARNERGRGMDWSLGRGETVSRQA